jgi:hypothetical protein
MQGLATLHTLLKKGSMRRLVFAFCCAATTLTAQQTRARIGLPGFKDQFPIEDVAIAFTLDAPVGRSYAAVKAAFADLKLPVDADDSVGGVVGKQRSSAQINFAGYRMSRIFDCGMSTMGQNADSFRLTIVFLALLDPVDASHTRLRVGVVAGGEPTSGPRGNAVQCGSTGVLEAKLVDLASRHLK